MRSGDLSTRLPGVDERWQIKSADLPSKCKRRQADDKCRFADLSTRCINEMNGVLGHLCAHVG